MFDFSSASGSRKSQTSANIGKEKVQKSLIISILEAILSHYQKLIVFRCLLHFPLFSYVFYIFCHWFVIRGSIGLSLVTKFGTCVTCLKISLSEASEIRHVLCGILSSYAYRM